MADNGDQSRLKRKRLDSSGHEPAYSSSSFNASAESLSVGENHESLYLDDGNIALCASRGSGKDVIFRVHRSMLSKHSPVFADMFALPIGENEMYDGVPLVRMPDHADQLEGLLKMLYFESLLPFKHIDSDTMQSIKATLIMANKYEIDHLRDRIVLQLETDWPQHLRQWDALEDEIDTTVVDFTEAQGEKDIDSVLSEPVAAIRLARECNIPQILPAAFYHLSRISIHDDTRMFRGPASESRGYGQRTAEWHNMTPDDYICFLKGREALRGAIGNLLAFTERSPEQHRNVPDRCSLSKRSELFSEIVVKCRDSMDVLSTARNYLENTSFGDEICAQCSLYIRMDLREFRARLWMQLPQIFGFPPVRLHD